MSDGDVQEPQQTADEPRGRSRRFVAVLVAIVVCVIVGDPPRAGGRHLVVLVLRQLPLHEAGVSQLGARRPFLGLVRQVPHPARHGRRRQVAHHRGAQHLAHLPQHEALEGQPAASGQRELRVVSPAQGPHGHPRQDPYAARAPHQPEQPGVHRLPRPHGARGARREQRGQHGALHHVSRADHGSQRLRLLPLHASRGRVAPHGLHRRARQPRARQRARLPALSPQQAGVLRRLSREAHAGPLLGQLAVCARQGSPEGPRPLPRVPHGGAAVQSVPHRGPSGRLGHVARSGRRQGHPVLPGLSPHADV